MKNIYKILKGKKYARIWCKDKSINSNFPFIKIQKMCNMDSLKLINDKFHVECEYKWCIEKFDDSFYCKNKDNRRYIVTASECKKELLRRFKALILQEI